MSTITWLRPSGTEIELDSKFDPKKAKALGLKKKPGPKKKEPVEQVTEKPVEV